MNRKSKKALVKEELDRLHSQAPDGLLTTSAVVKAATNPKSPIHNCFEWDDKVAGHKYRLHQAGMLMISYKIIVPGIRQPLHARYSLTLDRAKEGGGYRETQTILDNEALTEELKLTAIRDIKALCERYGMFADLLAELQALLRKFVGPKLEEKEEDAA